MSFGGKKTQKEKKGMKILLVCEYYPPHIGGVEFVFSSLAQGLARRGNECHVVTCRLPDTPKYEEIEGVKVHRVGPPHRLDRYMFTFLAAPKVMQLARSVDLVQTTQFNAAFPAWAVAKLLRKKSVITIHEVWGALWSSMCGMNRVLARQYRTVERAMLELPFDKYVCVSANTRNALRRVGVKEDKIEVIYNGVDEELFDPEKADGERVRQHLGLENKFMLLFYGRPGMSKGLEYLLKATPMIRQRIPHSQFVLLLSRRPENGYNDAIKITRTLDLNGQLTIKDPVPRHELPDYLAAADCIVVPSLSEGFGFTAAESCAMERPVIASDVASLPEVVSGRYVLVEPRNPAAIAEAVEKVYRGEVDRQPKKRFSWDECVDRYVKVYEGLLA